MKTVQENNLIFIRLFPNESVINCLLDACKKYQVQTAVVISGIGQLKDITLGYFKEKGNYTPETFSKPHELLNLSGNIIFNKDTYLPHIHVVLGNEKKQVIGGHLIEGFVEVTNEIVLIRSSAKLKRKNSVETGLNELIIPSET